jgi:hypothetical protein
LLNAKSGVFCGGDCRICGRQSRFKRCFVWFSATVRTHLSRDEAALATRLVMCARHAKQGNSLKNMIQIVAVAVKHIKAEGAASSRPCQPPLGKKRRNNDARQPDGPAFNFRPDILSLHNV